MSKDIFLFSFSILLCWVDWYPLYCNQYLSYLSSQLSPVWFFLHTSICFFSPFCSVSGLEISSHTYIHTSYPHVSLLHSWMWETKYTCFIIFFFLCSSFCSLFLVPIAWAKFWRALWLINIFSWQLFSFFFSVFCSFFRSLNRKKDVQYSTVSRDSMHITLVDRIFPIISNFVNVNH